MKREIEETRSWLSKVDGRMWVILITVLGNLIATLARYLSP